MNMAGQELFQNGHGQWALLSYVWVLETNSACSLALSQCLPYDLNELCADYTAGATWRVGYLRLVSESTQ